MSAANEKLEGVWWLLRIALGVGIFLAGLDKFFEVLTTWSMYLSPLAERLLPVSPDAFLRAVGIAEMAMGVAVLSRWPRAGAYALSAWLVGIAVNLALAAHFWDLVVRDLEVAASAFALARIGEWRAATSAAASPERGPEALRSRGATP